MGTLRKAKAMGKLSRTILVCALAVTCWGVAANLQAVESVTARENLEKLKKTNSCRNCDLAGLNMNRLDLRGADLQGADLSMTTFHLANLAGADLKKAILRGAAFGGADLDRADLREADLRGANLEGAYLGGARLDGTFIATKPYQELGIEGVEKEVYIEDQTKSKTTPAPASVTVGSRRDLGEPPPVVPQPSKEMNPPEKPEKPLPVAPQMTAMAPPPMKKNVVPLEQVDMNEPPPQPKPEPKVAADIQKIAKPPAGEKVVAESTVTQLAPKDEKQKAAGQNVHRHGTQSVVEAVSESAKSDLQSPPVAVKEGSESPSIKLAADKKKRDNLSRLLDSNKCYGCDLAGLDLSGEDLEGADLEKADLSGCNLTKADLDEANLKGAQLRGAILAGASLKEADLYKADLRDADFTGARLENTLFDNAQVAGAIGLPVMEQ